MPPSSPVPERTRVGAGVLLGLVLLAVATRLWFATGPADGLALPGDAVTYREMASHLAAGDGLLLGRPGDGVPEPTAEHPPAFPALLAALDLLGLGSEDGHRLGLVVVSALAVALVALIGSEVGGRPVGITAGLVAALHPTWLQPAAMVMSESLYLVAVSAVVWWGLRGVGSWRHLAVLGALVGAAALVRPEGLGLLLAVGGPAIWRSRTDRRVQALAVAAAAAVLVVGPWVVRNVVRVDAPVLSTNVGKTIQGSSCDDTFSGPLLGGFSYDCQLGAAVVLIEARGAEGRTWTGAELDRALGEIGLDHVRANLGGLPKVVAARVARTWGVAFLDAQLDFDEVEGRVRSAQRAAQVVHLALLPLAVAGAVAVRRRGGWTALAVLAGPLALVTLSSLVVYGGPRMRTAAEPSLAVLAAAGAVHLLAWARQARSVRAPGPQVA